MTTKYKNAVLDDQALIAGLKSINGMGRYDRPCCWRSLGYAPYRPED
ncbi:hypothetical protein JCM19236_3343 [Vibrio sp. JCM 19236]|nr:hypothetical protein JCM19236_3343 [Vibrio sp. JCM 19236]